MTSTHLPLTEAEAGPSVPLILQFSRRLIQVVERQRFWVVGFWSALYLFRTCLVASRKPFWYDELLTLYVSRLPHVSDIWKALAAGVDVNPPFYYLITRVSMALFGEGELAIRLPAILGFWVMTLCLFRFVSKRSTAFLGVIAALLQLETAAYNYAYEARPYGLLLACCGLSLLCWQAATESRRRGLALAGLTLSLSAAISSHYYGILLLFPPALGEIVRCLYRRRIDWPIWASVGISPLPLVFFRPLIHGAMSYSAGFWAKPNVDRISGFYVFLLSPSLRLAVAALLCGAILLMLSSRRQGISSAANGHSAFQPYEIAAAVGLVLFPVMIFVLSRSTGAFTERYALPATVGFSILVAWIASIEGSRGPILAMSLFLVWFGWFCAGYGLFAVKQAAVALRRGSPAVPFQTPLLLLSTRNRELPIVISSGTVFLQLDRYAPPELKPRLVSLTDLNAALRLSGTDSVDRALMVLRQWRPVKVEDYARFVQTHQRFLLYACPGQRLEWLVSKLLDDGHRLELEGKSGGCVLFLTDSSRPN